MFPKSMANYISSLKVTTFAYTEKRYEIHITGSMVRVILLTYMVDLTETDGTPLRAVIFGSKVNLTMRELLPSLTGNREFMPII
ncbi:hypothetical protein SAMN04488168_1502 [Bacillus sp. 491mf]|nr:hypothetical protein SAMN04488168_1502 [Bacillus sp. 491mf]